LISDSVLEERLHLYIRGLRKEFQASFVYCQEETTEDCVHDCRVYLRRWMALCDLLGAMFQQSSPSYVLHRKEFRKLHKAFSPLRDLHVSISYLQSYEKKESQVTELMNGMEKLSSQEKKLLEEKLRSLRVKTYNNIQKSIKHEFQGLTEERVLYKGLQDQVSAIYKNTGSYVNALKLEEIETFHALRINLKKLRYTLEFLHSLDKEKTGVIKILKEFHDELGVIQDFEVLGLNIDTVLRSSIINQMSSLYKEEMKVQQWIKEEIHSRTEVFFHKKKRLLGLDL